MAPASPMETLPMDVWHHVFSFACTDGGFTGGSLARTSHAFRAASAPYRFHSIQLSSTKHIDKFLSVYEAALAAATASSTDPPHVRHLLFTFLPGKVDMIILEGSFHFRDFHSWQSAKISWNQRFVALVTRLLELVAPRLETFTVLQSPNVPLPYVRCGPLPALRELTLLHGDTLFVRSPTKEYSWIEPDDDNFFGAGRPPSLEELAASPTFPMLARLHLAGGTWALTLPLWAGAAPHLVNLRISGADEATERALRDLLVEPCHCRALRKIVVQSKLDPDASEDQKAARAGVLHEAGVARAKTEVDVEPALIASESHFSLPEWTARLTEEWMARATGEPGSR